MIRISVKPEEIVLAKQMRDKLDSVKKYDKIDCSTNYIGVLGEIVLHRYLNEQQIEHKWIDFLRDGKSFNEPDFIFNNIDIDLKTTYSDSMWFQKPKFSIYIYAHISQDDKELQVISFATKSMLERAIKEEKAKTVKRGNREDYVINPMDIPPIEFLWRNRK